MTNAQTVIDHCPNLWTVQRALSYHGMRTRTFVSDEASFIIGSDGYATRLRQEDARLVPKDRVNHHRYCISVEMERILIRLTKDEYDGSQLLAIEQRALWARVALDLHDDYRDLGLIVASNRLTMLTSKGVH